MDATATPQMPVPPVLLPPITDGKDAPSHDDRVLTGVPTATAPPTAADISIPRIKKRRAPRTFFRLSRIGEYIQEWGGILFFGLLGILLWRADAHFTLWFFAGWTPGISGAIGPWQWAIPVLFSLGQIYFFVGPEKLKRLYAARKLAADYPDHEPSYRSYIRLRKKVFRHMMGFVAVSIINIGTSAQGMYEWSEGRYINLFGGFTLPQAGISLRILCIILGVVLAFGAEKAFKAAWDEYKER